MARNQPRREAIMSNIARGCSAKLLAGTLLMSVAVAGPVEAYTYDLKVCAAFHLHFFTLIEDLGDTGEASTAELVAAADLLQQASVTCQLGAMTASEDLFNAIALPEPTPRSLPFLHPVSRLADSVGISP
jgi:hypothetical protein